MATRVQVKVSRDGDGERLLQSLEQRGLEGRIVEDTAGEVVEIAYATTERDRLVVDVETALEAWIAEQDAPLVPTLVDGTFVLHPPGD